MAKKVMLLVVFTMMLGGLTWWIKHFGGITVVPRAAKPKPAEHLDAAMLSAQWPQIIAHAAAPPRGNAAARYTLAEFGDFQCPQCGEARPFLEKMLRQHPAQVNLIFIHRPFPQVHQWAISAGQASEIAAAQGKFWQLYDVLYLHQEDLEPGFYGDYAAQVGLNKAQFQKAFSAGQGRDKVSEAAAFADSLGVDETPTILVHDNKVGTVTIYVGMHTQMNKEDNVPYPGVDSLVANPPWGGS